MIFVSVGSHEPFERLVDAVDAWAAARGRTDVFAQIGPSPNTPATMRWTRFLTPEEFRSTVASASIVVAHAGAGCILTALDCHVPIVVMPRREALGETRSEHQLPMAERFAARGLVTLVRDESALAATLDELDRADSRPEASVPRTDPRLLGVIRAMVENLKTE